MRNINYNLRPNELMFGDSINQELRSIHENFQEIKDLYIVSELPERIDVGVLLFHNNTLWRGLSEGESSFPPVE